MSQKPTTHISNKNILLGVFVLLVACATKDDYFYDNTRTYDAPPPYNRGYSNQPQPQYYQQQYAPAPQPQQYYYPAPTTAPAYYQAPHYASPPYSQQYSNPYENRSPARYDSDYYYTPPTRYNNVEPTTYQYKSALDNKI